jgi:glycosyltransferase involved in cell wall biosynthesis
MEDKKKIRVLAVASDATGVGYYRTIWPHQYAQEITDEFDFDIMNGRELPKDNLADFLKNYDMMVFHKMLDKDCRIIDLAKYLGLVVVCDIDDYWRLGPDHPLNYSSIRNKWPEVISNHIRKADHVTTTTEIFADKIKAINPNVTVLENGIDSTFMPQFSEEKNPRPSGRLRIGILCGSAHLHDIELMKGIANLPKDTMAKIQLVECGKDFRGSQTIYNRKTGESRVVPLERSKSVWVKYTELLTDNYKTVTKEHEMYLKSYMDGDDPFKDDAFRAFHTRPINEYARNYANLDVLLAPLKENDFNKCKSALKVAECAYSGTMIMCTNFGPYTIDLRNYFQFGGGVDENANAILIDSSKNHKNWSKYITFLANNQEVVPLLASNLKRDVYEKYSLRNITERRLGLYKDLYIKNKVESSGESLES